MKTLARLALRLLTGAGTVFIAACYGVPYDGVLRAGKVVDAQTRAAIPGILVSCLGSGGSTIDQAHTDGQGEVELRGECIEYRAEDVDGATNGTYATKTIADAGEIPFVIALDPIP
jgi:hypothetical protein